MFVISVVTYLVQPPLMGGMIAISSAGCSVATSPAGRYSWLTASANAPLISSREGNCRRTAGKMSD